MLFEKTKFEKNLVISHRIAPKGNYFEISSYKRLFALVYDNDDCNFEYFQLQSALRPVVYVI